MDKIILRNIVDIDPSSDLIEAVEELAIRYTLFDMKEVLVVSMEMMKHAGDKAMFIINDDTATEVIKTLLSAAILNFASAKHEVFYIPVSAASEGGFVAQRIVRNYTSEEHQRAAGKFLTQATELINKYEQRTSPPAN